MFIKAFYYNITQKIMKSFCSVAAGGGPVKDCCRNISHSVAAQGFKICMPEKPRLLPESFFIYHPGDFIDKLFCLLRRLSFGINPQHGLGS